MSRKYGEEKVQIERLLKVHEQIRSGLYPNAKSLAKDLEVSERTILRDIEYLRDRQNAPVEFDRKKNGFYYTKPAYFLQSVLLSEEELQLLVDMGILVGNYEGKDKKETNLLNNTFRKILTVLPEEKTKDIPFSPSKNEHYTEIFEPIVRYSRYLKEELENCVKNKEVIEIDYCKTSNKKYKLYTLKPIHVFNEENRQYLLALNMNNKSGIYSINRIRKLNKIDTIYELPENLNIPSLIKTKKEASHYDNKMYNFELSFPKEIAKEAIERYYYFNQKIELQKDESVLVSFRSTQLYDVFFWVLSQGHKVKVINPPELLSMVKKEIRLISQYYN